VDLVQRCVGEVLADEGDVKKGERCNLGGAWELQRCVGVVLAGEGDVKKGERWFLAVRGWDLESVASMSYFLCISGYFLSIAAWLFVGPSAGSVPGITLCPRITLHSKRQEAALIFFYMLLVLWRFSVRCLHLLFVFSGFSAEVRRLSVC